MSEIIPASEAARAADQGQYLTFMLGTEVFAIGILAIKEIIEYHTVTPVPMMPAWVCGVINLRGAVVPVLDLAARFGRRPAPITKRTCIVIAEVQGPSERQVVGVLVDAVSQVLSIPPAEIEPPPTFGARIRTEFMRGMGKVEGRFVILLDVDHVLSVDELGALPEQGAAELSADGRLAQA